MTGEKQGRREVYRIPEGIAQGAINFDPAQKGKNVKNAIGSGVSYVIYWKCSEDFGQELFKVSLTIYQKDILQVCVLSLSFIEAKSSRIRINTTGWRCKLHALDVGLLSFSRKNGQSS